MKGGLKAVDDSLHSVSDGISIGSDSNRQLHRKRLLQHQRERKLLKKQRELQASQQLAEVDSWLSGENIASAGGTSAASSRSRSPGGTRFGGLSSLSKSCISSKTNLDKFFSHSDSSTAAQVDFINNYNQRANKNDNQNNRNNNSGLRNDQNYNYNKLTGGVNNNNSDSGGHHPQTNLTGGEIGMVSASLDQLAKLFSCVTTARPRARCSEYNTAMHG